MSYVLSGLTTLFLLNSPCFAQVAQKPDSLANRVRLAMDKGVEYLRKNQLTFKKNDQTLGHWELDTIHTSGKYDGGQTSLALLGLLNAGVPVQDEIIQNGLRYLRTLNPTTTYVRSLQTMALAEAYLKTPTRADVQKLKAVDLDRIRQNLLWLANNRAFEGGAFSGWGYPSTNRADNSNTQYALLGLLAGKQVGLDMATLDDKGQPVWPSVWKDIRKAYETTQAENGGWHYLPSNPKKKLQFATGTYLTMTSAGVCGLFIAGQQLNQGREIFQANGVVNNCGRYEENVPIRKALDFISNKFRLELPVGANRRITYYNLYGLERVGRLSGERFLGKHDWYREGCDYLVEHQDKFDGSWHGTGSNYDRWKVVSTGFALLFLSKGRTPVLISRLVHGTWPREQNDMDWNNDRNAMKHLTEFVSKEVFENVPLAWQIYDIRRAVVSRGGIISPEVNDSITSDMLQSPVLFLNGHKNPMKPPRFTKNEQIILKKYVESGGFIFAEACCGDKDFDEGFHQLVNEIWGQDLEDVPNSSPIWRSFFQIEPGSVPLKGLRMGCKTVLVYCPVNISCYWESDLQKDDGKGTQAFRVGANVIAYATGLRPPKPRLTPIAVVSDKKDPTDIPRNYLKVAQIQHAGDWQPAPHAMKYLMNHMHDTAKIDVVLKPRPLTLDHEYLSDFKFLYMHGREETFKFNKIGLENLRINLEKGGGLLFADACCGSKKFDTGFKAFMKELFPKHKLQPVPVNDVLYSQRLNGKDINTVLCRQTLTTATGKAAPFKEIPPALLGIKINGRWVVLYSEYDIGCALERNQSPDCRGYETESAYRLGRAAVLYLLNPLAFSKN